MAKYTDASCKLCRREGMKLFLKGERCTSKKCAMESRAFAPGQHGTLRKKSSEYSIQLREKQKAKRIDSHIKSGMRFSFLSVIILEKHALSTVLTE